MVDTPSNEIQFEQSMRAAAQIANSAISRAISRYSAGYVTDEDDLTGVLLGALDASLNKKIEGLKWSAAVVRHRRGHAAEEKKIGADLVIHVRVNTPFQKYSKGVLVQAKRVEPNEFMSAREHRELISQCEKMLSVSAASFVFDYATNSMRCGSASKISGSMNRNLYSACNWTSYRFFFELFRCPIGDTRFTSALVSELPVPSVIKLAASGDGEDLAEFVDE